MKDNMKRDSRDNTTAPITLWGNKPYRTINYELKNKYGEKIYKIALDAGMTCPNRDGTLGTRGCIFCSEGGSGDFASSACSKENISISEQLENGKKLFKEKNVGKLFIAYFQSFTNTYAPIPYLEKIFSEALSVPDVVGISIGTRPDCINDECIELFQKLKERFPSKFIWVELGLQTIHEDTAILIRRGYPLPVFEDTVKKLSTIDIDIIVHVILGLPGENKEMMLETCKYLNSLGIDGIKLQLLHVLKNTDLETLYRQKSFEILSLEEYIDIVISCLEVISSDIIIHRVTGDGPKNILIDPIWSTNKKMVLNTLHKELKTRNSYQGKLI